MTTETNFTAAVSYHYLYNFLQVLNEDQIAKLKNVVIGAKSLSSFSEHEIKELENKMKEKKELLMAM